MLWIWSQVAPLTLFLECVLTVLVAVVTGRFTKEIWDLNMDLIFLQLPWLQGFPLVIHSSRRSMPFSEGGYPTSVSDCGHDQCLTHGNLCRAGNSTTSPAHLSTEKKNKKSKKTFPNVKSQFLCCSLTSNSLFYLSWTERAGDSLPFDRKLSHTWQLLVCFHGLSVLLKLINPSPFHFSSSLVLSGALVMASALHGLPPMFHISFNMQCSRLGTGIFGQGLSSCLFHKSTSLWTLALLWSLSPTNPSPESSQHPASVHLNVPECFTSQLSMLVTLWFPYIQSLICHYYLDFSASPSACQLSPAACKFNNCSPSHHWCHY